LEPGDLILVSSKKPRFPATSIRSYQSNLYTEDHACWQHVAISAGRFDIIEATAFGVKFCTYWHYMTGDHNIKVRRLANADKATRTMVALYAAAQVRSWYGYSNLSNIAAILAGADAWRKPLITSGVICSQLYVESCMKAGFFLANFPSQNVSPAYLSICDLLETQPLKWVKA
jgi:hypothetical protein